MRSAGCSGWQECQGGSPGPPLPPGSGPGPAPPWLPAPLPRSHIYKTHFQVGTKNLVRRVWLMIVKLLFIAK